jgi:hypothetical protein
MSSNALFITHPNGLIRGEPIADLTYDFATYVRGAEIVPVAPQPVMVV